MAEVHSTSLLKGDVDLADEVEVGPGCVLDATMGPIRLGSRTALTGNVYLTGPLTMGEGNVVYPFACLGFAPQHVKYDPAEGGRGIVVGDGNTFREHVTIHRAFTDQGPTRIGHRNFFMAGSHAGHDCVIADDCTLVNGALLAGHVQVDEKVLVGGGAVVHQFVRIGRGAMIGGGMGTGLSVPPWFIVTGINIAGSVNLIGMKRNNVPRAEIDAARWVHRTLYRSGLSMPSAKEKLETRADEPIVAEYLAFIENSERGICHGPNRAVRSVR